MKLKWLGKRIHDAIVAGRKVILGLGGLGSINAAVWVNSLTWGLVTTGFTLLLLQFMSEPEVR